MKHVLIFLAAFLISMALSMTLFASSAVADPGGPIVPWPANVKPVKILPEDLQGEWFGFGENTLWFVNISIHSGNPSVLTVFLESPGLFGGNAQGFAYPDRELFWGLARSDSSHAAGFVIFKENGTITLRVSRNMDDVQDMQLFRMKKR